MLTIGITTHNRLSTLKTMAASLYQSNIAIPHNIRIYDDNSTEFDIDELKRLFPTAASIKVNTRNLKADQNTFQMYEDFLNTPDEYLFTADSDLIFKKNCLDIGLELIKKTSGILTLLNANSHPVEEDIDEDLCLKKTIGCAGTLLHRDRVAELVSHIHSQKNSKSLDWQFSMHFNSQDILIYCVKNSLVQHIGYSGQNSFIYFDYGKNFKIESAEQGQILNDVLENYVHEIGRLEKERIDNLSYHFRRFVTIILKKLLPRKLYIFLRQKFKK